MKDEATGKTHARGKSATFKCGDVSFSYNKKFWLEAVTSNYPHGRNWILLACRYLPTIEIPFSTLFFLFFLLLLKLQHRALFSAQFSATSTMHT